MDSREVSDFVNETLATLYGSSRFRIPLTHKHRYKIDGYTPKVVFFVCSSCGKRIVYANWEIRAATMIPKERAWLQIQETFTAVSNLTRSSMVDVETAAHLLKQNNELRRRAYLDDFDLDFNHVEVRPLL